MLKQSLSQLKIVTIASLLVCSGMIAVEARGGPGPESPPPEPVIVQGVTLGDAIAAVRTLKAPITHSLQVIDAVGTRLTVDQIATLRKNPCIKRVWGDNSVAVAGKTGGGSTSPNQGKDTVYPTVIGAADVQKTLKLYGNGVTMAVLDTGLWARSSLIKTHTDKLRVLAFYDAGTNQLVRTQLWDDPAGHGSHVTSAAVNSTYVADGVYEGVAPGANLLVVKAFGSDGRGSYANVIRGIDFVVQNKSKYNVRILNLSFSTAPRSHYWDDPLNQAVMKAWAAGIVVVASAGNTGPGPMTIGVPGNVPYVMTVGAMSDNYTKEKSTDNFLTSFSSAGPTYEGFVKPEIVAPGGHILGVMPSNSTIAGQHPEFHDGAMYFTMSGTSQSAAIVSGAIALLLEAEPWLTPDQVKGRLMAYARPAVKDPTVKPLQLAYSVFQQGAGAIHIYDAIKNSRKVNPVANVGLDIKRDLAGTAHFGGRANRTATGEYYVMGLQGDGYIWNNGYIWSDGYLWSDAYLWSDGYLWSDAYIWSDGYLWNNAYLWNDAYLWSDSLSETASINSWVPQE